MTFRKKTARGISIALSLTLLFGACAEARPVGDPRAAGPLTVAAGGYELQVLVDGLPAPTFFSSGETYVMGALGERYTLRILNHTGRRIEAVASVDGRDVVDGRGADMHKRGYIVPAWGSVDIDGWRLTRAQVAAFRFSSVADSYAARTGSAREVGVIGAAIFPERFVPRPRPLELPYADPRASGQRPSTRPRFDDDASGGGAELRRAAPTPGPGVQERRRVGRRAPFRAIRRGARRRRAVAPPRPGHRVRRGRRIVGARGVLRARELELAVGGPGRPLQRPRRPGRPRHRRRPRRVRGGLGLRPRPRPAPDRRSLPRHGAPLRRPAPLLERPRLPLTRVPGGDAMRRRATERRPIATSATDAVPRRPARPQRERTV